LRRPCGARADPRKEEGEWPSMLLTDVAQWISNGRREPVTVVIGSGAIGLYAASELVKRGRRMVESSTLIV